MARARANGRIVRGEGSRPPGLASVLLWVRQGGLGQEVVSGPFHAPTIQGCLRDRMVRPQESLESPEALGRGRPPPSPRGWSATPQDRGSMSGPADRRGRPHLLGLEVAGRRKGPDEEGRLGVPGVQADVGRRTPGRGRFLVPGFRRPAHEVSPTGFELGVRLRAAWKSRSPSAFRVMMTGSFRASRRPVFALRELERPNIWFLRSHGLALRGMGLVELLHDGQTAPEEGLLRRHRNVPLELQLGHRIQTVGGARVSDDEDHVLLLHAVLAPVEVVVRFQGLSVTAVHPEEGEVQGVAGIGEVVSVSAEEAQLEFRCCHQPDVGEPTVGIRRIASSVVEGRDLHSDGSLSAGDCRRIRSWISEMTSPPDLVGARASSVPPDPVACEDLVD